MRDRMGIERASEADIPDYRSLYLIKRGKTYDGGRTSINEYGASDDADIELLPLLSDGRRGSAAPGSTCLFDSGKLERLGVESWALFGGSGSQSAISAAPTSLNVSPLNLDRNALTGSADLGDDQTVETLDFDTETVDEITADEVSDI